MINTGLVTWATQKRTQQSWKKYEKINEGLGIALHSMEGNYTEPPPRQGDPNVSSSYMFAIKKDGELVQYYPVTASTWTSGNSKANTELWSVEMVGFAGQEPTRAQKNTLTRLVEEWERYTQRRATRDLAAPRTLWEHNEVAKWVEPNAGAVACPSHRYDNWYDEWDARISPPDSEPDSEDSDLAILNTMLRNREMLRNLASQTTQIGEGKLRRGVKLLQEAGILPLD